MLFYDALCLRYKACNGCAELKRVVSDLIGVHGSHASDAGVSNLIVVATQSRFKNPSRKKLIEQRKVFLHKQEFTADADEHLRPVPPDDKRKPPLVSLTPWFALWYLAVRSRSCRILQRKI